MKIQKYSPDKIADNYDAIIIGSGISGLCTAALLSMNNQKVLVLEKHFKVGGYTHTFKRQNFEWDVGIHYIGGVHLKKTFTRRLFDKITNNNLKWNKMSDNYDRIIFPDKSYDFVAPKDRFIENMMPQTVSVIELGVPNKTQRKRWFDTWKKLMPPPGNILIVLTLKNHV